ncbi:hypothetical protein LPJ60_001611 [Coemansia sp. RSA 2675]|nr:hypothetical protein LPJ60_001611 [Coemansia sp. RSA 2675]
MSDDVTTIFVGGIPDDMKEREFQNMFTFSTGFEAASLKFPSADGALDKDGQKKQIIGFAKFHSRMAALEARDILTGRRVDADSNCVLKAEMAKKDLHTRRGLSSLGPASAVGATFGVDTPSSSALMGARQPALPQSAALMQKTGQKVQMQKPPMSALPQIQPQGVPRTSSLTNTTMAAAAAAAAAAGQRRPEHLRISGARAFNPFNDAPLASAPIMGAKAHRGFGTSSAFSSSGQTVMDPSAHHHVAAAAVSAIPQMPGTAGAMGAFMQGDQMMASSMMLNRRGSVHGSTPVSGAMATNAPTSAAPPQHIYGNGYQQVQYQQSVPMSEPHSPDEHDSFHMSAPLPVQPQQPPKGLGAHRPAVLDIAALQPRLSQLSLGQMSAATAAMMTPMGGAPFSASAVTTPGGMMLPMANTRSVNSNDQNPPCNTIYVGNLPFGAKEDELYTIFRNSLGYKRMSYRAKPNSGPMCFVEFENIDFATLAMNEHDGRMLSNSVNGGIRLSYSKNPLGVRAQGNPTTPTGAGNGFQQHMGPATPYGYSAGITQQPLLQSSRLHGVSPVHHQGMSGYHKDNSSPSPPAPAQQHYQQQQMYSGHYHHHHHQLSISSSSATSPMPSPNTAVHSSGNPNDDMTAVPKDALSFLHQPIHQLHKQATSGDPTNISTGPSTPPLTSTANITLD